mmetsp:Transcript_17196/g.38725  ORF Transcript_17196/g.38725 Transcript_17196/m.38725 type:complete len:141 (+) Transcript_17196:4375-4797(+)
MFSPNLSDHMLRLFKCQMEKQKLPNSKAIWKFNAKLQISSGLVLLPPCEEEECDIFENFCSDRFLFVEVESEMGKRVKSVATYVRSRLDNIWIASRQWRFLSEDLNNVFIFFAIKGVGLDRTDLKINDVQEWWKNRKTTF